MSALDRRSFLRGAALLICAPAIIRASSLMPVKAWAGDGVAFTISSPINTAGEQFIIAYEDFSEAALEDLIIEVRRQTDVYGNRVRLIPRCLLPS